MSKLAESLSNRSQFVLVDARRRKLVNVVSGVPCNVLGSVYCSSCQKLLILKSDFFSMLENELIVNADDNTSMAVIPSQSVRVAVAESLNRDLGKVGEWCDLEG